MKVVIMPESDIFEEMQRKHLNMHHPIQFFSIYDLLNAIKFKFYYFDLYNF